MHETYTGSAKSDVIGIIGQEFTLKSVLLKEFIVDYLQCWRYIVNGEDSREGFQQDKKSLRHFGREALSRRILSEK